MESGVTNQRDMFMKPENENYRNENPFDLLKALGLRRKKKDEKYKKYAGLNRRMLASTIDTSIAIIIFVPFIDLVVAFFTHAREISLEEYQAIKNNSETWFAELLKLLIDSGKMSELLLNSTLQLVTLLVASAICWKLWSATPGKMLLRMKIVDADTQQPMTDRQILLRCFGYILSCSVFFLGIFWISFNKRHQGWHDKIANTVVIITSKKKDITKELPESIV